jgi:Secretion system C-terminal sorting domain
MKTTYLLKSTLVVILILGACVNTRAEYVKDPTLCNGVDASWDATARKFTVKGLHGSIIEPWIAYLTDPSWCSTCFVDICPYGTYIPGSSTFTSSRLGTAYGNPLVHGANGSSAAFIALKSTSNDLPKGAKSEDCSVTCDGSCLNSHPAPSYCDNYNATFDGSTINVTGIFNWSNDNMFMIATSDHSKWQTVSIKVDPTDPDKGSADVSAIQFYNTNENVYPYAKGVMFYMSSDDKGVGISGQGPNYCSKSFTPPITNSISDIIANNITITITPNPATPFETITIQGEYASDAKVSIISASGAMVGSVTPTVGANAMTVPLSGLNLQAGIYFVRIESGVKVYIGKLCVK